MFIIVFDSENILNSQEENWGILVENKEIKQKQNQPTSWFYAC